VNTISESFCLLKMRKYLTNARLIRDILPRQKPTVSAAHATNTAVHPTLLHEQSAEKRLLSLELNLPQHTTTVTEGTSAYLLRLSRYLSRTPTKLLFMDFFSTRNPVVNGEWGRMRPQFNENSHRRPPL
jgi:hypothetical protein